MIIVPEAYAFSPNDEEVLIKMELVYVSLPTKEKEEAAKAGKTYKTWWYVVDSSNGQVKHEYRTNRLPKRWWAS